MVVHRFVARAIRGRTVDHAGGVNPKLRLVAERQGGVFSRGQALASGYTHRQILHRLDDGRWVRIRRGQYAERLDITAVPPWEQQRIRHTQAVHAVMNALRDGSVVASHQTAIALHGLPLWGLELDRIHVTRLDHQAGGLVAGVQHHIGELTQADQTRVDGVAVTTVPRALVETACTASFEGAVVCADAVLRRGGVDEPEMQRLLRVIDFWPGSPKARAVLAFASSRSESVGESRLRVLMHQFGLPDPELQAEFHDADGFVARVDFYFPEYDTVVEFDGLLKYGDGSPEVLIREKRREDRLRALGLQVVRSEWSDFSHPAHLVATITQAFARAARAA